MFNIFETIMNQIYENLPAHVTNSSTCTSGGYFPIPLRTHRKAKMQLADLQRVTNYKVHEKKFNPRNKLITLLLIFSLSRPPWAIFWNSL